MLPYMIVTENSVDDLVDVVNELISQGYKPVGGITIHGGFYMQAMYIETTNVLVEEYDEGTPYHA